MLTGLGRNCAFISLVVLLASTSVHAQQRPAAPRAGAQGSPARNAAAAAPAAPAAAANVPVKLTPEEARRIDSILLAWEKESDKVKLFKCKFTRWDYDKTFGPKANNFLVSERHGEIKFRAPDRGTFKELDMLKFNADTGEYEKTVEGVDHWVCDGTAIYQFRAKEKILEVLELPPEMRGKAITEGPLPFIFGAKAATLKARYWIKEETPPEVAQTQIWLTAYPKFQQQAANFHHVKVILGMEDMMPIGMEVTLPNKQDFTSYLFEDRKVNDHFGNFIDGDFLPPMKPLGWKKVVHPAEPDAAQAPPAAPQKQASRPKATR